METKDLDSLKPDLMNPRKMSDHDANSLSRGIDEFGDLGVIVNNTLLDKVVGGHMRMETILAKDPAAKIYITERLAEQDVTGTTAWGYVIFNGRRLAYREVSWDAVKHGEANILANRAGGEWDLEKLGEYDQWLLDNGSDLIKTGQRADEIAQLLGNAPAEPAEPKDPRTSLNLKLTETQHGTIDAAINLLKSQKNLQDESNQDMDANAIYYICQNYLENQTL